MRGLIHPGLFTFPEHRGPVGAALIGSCLTVAKNKLISLQLFSATTVLTQPQAAHCAILPPRQHWGRSVSGNKGSRAKKGSYL